MQPRLFVITNSKVQTFLRCRKRFWYQYKSGIPWPADVMNAAGIVGTGVHRAMRVLGETGNAAVARQELDAYLRMPDHTEAAPGTEQGERALDLLAKGIAADQELAADSIDRWVELPPAMRWEKGGLEVRAQIDRVDQLALDHYRVIDWKTGKVDKDDETDLQLDIYHVALRHARQLSRETRVTAVAWNLETGHKRQRELQRDDAAGTMARLDALAGQMNRAPAYEATPNQLCVYCPWLDQCEEGQAAGFTPYDPFANGTFQPKTDER